MTIFGNNIHILPHGFNGTILGQMMNLTRKTKLLGTKKPKNKLEAMITTQHMETEIQFMEETVHQHTLTQIKEKQVTLDVE